MTQTTLLIRPARVDDATVVAQLLGELGYPQQPALIQLRLLTLSDLRDGAILLAWMAGRVVGLVGVHCIPVLHTEGGLGKITALVVEAPLRGQGIGQRLLTAAEQFARQAGCCRMEVISGNGRSDAHRFYQREGYDPTDQTRFIKTF